MMGISCLLLAAGQSKRMGTVNKLLLSVEGRSLVRYTAEKLKSFPFKEIIVVTGFEAKEIEEEILSLHLKTVHNSNFETGMHSSIRAGISHLSKDAKGFAVALADQPWLGHHVLNKLMYEFAQRQGPRIITPCVDGQRGNPVIISTHFIPEILAEPDGDYGCSYLLKRHPEVVLEVQVDDGGVLIDIDTPQDYEDHRQGNYEY